MSRKLDQPAESNVHVRMAEVLSDLCAFLVRSDAISAAEAKERRNVMISTVLDNMTVHDVLMLEKRVLEDFRQWPGEE